MPDQLIDVASHLQQCQHEGRRPTSHAALKTTTTSYGSVSIKSQCLQSRDQQERAPTSKDIVDLAISLDSQRLIAYETVGEFGKAAMQRVNRIHQKLQLGAEIDGEVKYGQRDCFWNDTAQARLATWLTTQDQLVLTDAPRQPLIDPQPAETFGNGGALPATQVAEAQPAGSSWSGGGPPPPPPEPTSSDDSSSDAPSKSNSPSDDDEKGSQSDKEDCDATPQEPDPTCVHTAKRCITAALRMPMFEPSRNE